MKLPRRFSLGKWLLIATLVAVAGSVSGWLPVDRLAGAVGRPLGSGLSSLGRGLGSRLSELGQLGGLSEQNRQLEAENNQLQQQLAEASQLMEENALLRQQLDFAQRTRHQLLGADVISYQPDGVRQFIKINRGSRDGINAGQAVVVSGSLVGRVVRAEAGYADVMLVSDPDFRVLVSSRGGQATGIVKGRPGGLVSMERVPRDQPLGFGDLIVTSGLDGEYPRGLAVGEVVNVGEADEGIFLVAQLKPPVDLKLLHQVLVITNE
ncbi:MAG: rod shape-determining protein MreC [Acidobacteriota bacterium]